MSELNNYVYIPYWLLLTLAGLAFIGFEYIVSRTIRAIERWTRPRPVSKPDVVFGKQDGRVRIVLPADDRHREAK